MRKVNVLEARINKLIMYLPEQGRNEDLAKAESEFRVSGEAFKRTGAVDDMFNVYTSSLR